MVAPDWRGSKGNYREWSKLRVELLLAGLNCSGMEQVEKSNPQTQNVAYGAPASTRRDGRVDYELAFAIAEERR